MRLDQYMVLNNLATGRDRAKEMILSGKVTVNGKECRKPSTEIKDECVSAEGDMFVGRGAKKIEKAFGFFNLDVSGKICIDAGAGTGGFTEYMLLSGAAKVYAADVGHGQLAEKLKNDGRVVNLEGTDIRKLSTDEKCSFFTCDVSFISLKQVLEPLYSLTDGVAKGVCLIKPQFEAGRAFIGKKGVVKDKKVHENVIYSILEFSRGVGFYPAGLTYSPVTGQNGNIEFLLLLEKEENHFAADIKKTVNEAWEALL